jgi:hypothetical protein
MLGPSSTVEFAKAYSPDFLRKYPDVLTEIVPWSLHTDMTLVNGSIALGGCKVSCWRTQLRAARSAFILQRK